LSTFDYRPLLEAVVVKVKSLSGIQTGTTWARQVDIFTDLDLQGIDTAICPLVGVSDGGVDAAQTSLCLDTYYAEVLVALYADTASKQTEQSLRDLLDKADIVRRGLIGQTLALAGVLDCRFVGQDKSVWVPRGFDEQGRPVLPVTKVTVKFRYEIQET
jgi:hypothetical protein